MDSRLFEESKSGYINSKKVAFTERQYMYEQTKEMRQNMLEWTKDIRTKELPKVTDVVGMRDFIYYIYPSFFMSGYCLGDSWIIINEDGEVKIEESDVNHFPHPYCFAQLSMLMTLCRQRFGWVLAIEQSSEIIEYCQRDFSPFYLKLFPNVVRLFTTSTSKATDYQRISRGIDFAYFDFTEVQGEIIEIVADKLLQIPEPEEMQSVMVDDAGLSFNCLGGAPGPYIKDFMLCMPTEQITALVEKMMDNQVFVEIAIGLRYMRKGIISYIIVHGRFPMLWEKSERDGHGFDPFLKYRGKPYLECVDAFHPREILLGWLWHRYRRRKIQLED